MHHNDSNIPSLSPLFASRVAKAVRSVVMAASDRHGHDCALYAHVGASLLRRLGHEARVVAGAASWRVGPGDGDVIANHPDAANAFAPEGAEGRSASFHAWIELEDAAGAAWVVDLTTALLRQKAQALDAADGGRTQVDFCPPYLWVPRPLATTLTNYLVGQSPVAGVFAYEAVPSLVDRVCPPAREAQWSSLVDAALLCYQMLARGETVTVLGYDEQGVDAGTDRPVAKLVPVPPVQS